MLHRKTGEQQLRVSLRARHHNRHLRFRTTAIVRCRAEHRLKTAVGVADCACSGLVQCSRARWRCHASSQEKEHRIMSRAMLKGAIAGSVFTLVVASSAVALAGTGVGGVFNLGQTNTVNKTSRLTGSSSTAMLRVDNTGAGPAARFNTSATSPPFAVASHAKVSGLNADLLDGNDASAFLTTTGTAANSAQLNGLAASAYQLHSAIHLVQGSATAVSAGGDGFAIATCGDSENAIAGGVRWNPVGVPASNLIVEMEGPSARGDGSIGGWRVDGHNGTASSVDLIPWALCIDK
jgi:hypothetical protein